MKHSPIRALAVVGAALVLMAGGAIAYAAIPSSTGVFTACMVKSSGTIRMIDTATTNSCRPGEEKISWNQAGQPGTPGTPGTNGTNGVSGYEIVTKQASHVAVLSDIRAFSEDVRCPTGKVATGGGADAVLVVSNQVFELLDLTSSRPIPPFSGNPGGWAVLVGKMDGAFFAPNETAVITVWATCVTAS